MRISARSFAFGFMTTAILSLAFQFPSALFAETSELVMPHIAGSGELPVYGVWSKASCANVPAAARAICVQGLPLAEFGVLKRFTKVEVVDFGIPQPDTAPTADVLKVLAGMPSIRAINLWCCSRIEGNWIEVIGSMKHLRELAIPRLGTMADEPRVPANELAKAIQSAGIERLDIGRSQLDGSLLDLLRSCKAIKHLAVDNHYVGQRLPEASLRELASVPLECLEIAFADVSDEFLAVLAKNPALQRIRFVHCDKMTPVGLGRLSKAPKLVALGFCGFKTMTDAHVEAISAMPNLEVVDLTLMAAITHTGRRAPWSDYKDYKVSSEAFRHLARLPKLKTLIAQQTPAINEAALECIARLPQLKTLDISQNDSWTAKGIAALAACPKLEELRLDCDASHDSPMNDDVIKELAGLPALTKLSMTGCEGATKAGFQSFEKMAKLRWLSVAGCTWVDAAFLASVSKLRGLEQLHLVYCNGVTDDGLAALKEHKSLRVLGVYGCGNVTDKSIDVFKSLPRLSILDLRRTKIFGDSAAKLAKELAEKQVEVAHY